MWASPWPKAIVPNRPWPSWPGPARVLWQPMSPGRSQPVPTQPERAPWHGDRWLVQQWKSREG
jgi:hypothetical protein